MTQPLQIRLNWEGSETIKTLEPILQQPCHIELVLASNYFHTICRQLHPDAPPGQTETLQEQGGGELLTKLAGIESLQLLGELAEPVAKAKGIVTITRPALITIEVPAT